MPYKQFYQIKFPTEKSFNDTPIKTNSSFGLPLDWFDKSILEGFGLNKLQFDFFINWNDNSLQKEIWLKRVYEVYRQSGRNRNIFTKTVLKEAIKDCDSRYFDIDKGINFLRSNELAPQYMVIKDLASPSDFLINNREITGKVVTAISCYDNDICQPTHLDLPTLRQRIFELTGTTIDPGKKLNITTSALESRLYYTGTVWPGDCDLLLFNNENKCVAIIELKKHNQIIQKLEQHSIQPYLHGKDRRKYQRLAILRDYFANKQNTLIPLVVLIYPTYENENRIKLEFLEGPWNKLQITDSKLLTGPITTENKKNILTTIINGGKNVNKK